ncbi:MAG: hypothetical protein AMXMBFR7_25470 [Planctomycetota bacterium]
MRTLSKAGEINGLVAQAIGHAERGAVGPAFETSRDALRQAWALHPRGLEQQTRWAASLSVALGSVGVCHLMRREWREALDCYRRAIRILLWLERWGWDWRGPFHVLRLAAFLHTSLNEKHEAGIYLRMAHDLAKRYAGAGSAGEADALDSFALHHEMHGERERQARYEAQAAAIRSKL